MKKNWKQEKIDIGFSKQIMKELAQISDCPSIGGRSAGSPAEHEAADYLVKKFKEAGLTNVTKDPCSVDTWVLKKAMLSYRDAQGKTQDILLGGYACDAVYKDESVTMIFAGKGTEWDYEDIDPKGKLVLIEIDQAEEWWINFPAYEAKYRGAVGVICMNTGGFGQEGDNVLVSEDLCGPSELMAFSIGKRDGEGLKHLIDSSEEKEIAVTLNIDSRVEKDGTSYNVWGDIPGKTDEVIYIINHYDSYYHTIFDDMQGIGWSLGLAKAFTNSGWKPEKTLRFIAHGAEEWGLVDCKYDWAIGAYQQITHIRPEWKENGFAVVNLDGFYAVKGEEKFCIVCTQELYDFVQEAAGQYGDFGGYEIEVNLKLTSSTEDFSYTKVGIPSFVAGAYDGCLADRKVLHSSDSDWEAGFDDKAFELFHNLFAHIIASLDEKRICPINLHRRLASIYEDILPELEEKEAMIFSEAVREANLLNENISSFNCREGETVQAKDLDQQLHRLYRLAHNQLIRLNWNDEMIAPHQRYADNLRALKEGLDFAQKGSYRSAAERLMDVDFNYYAAFFSRATVDYFEKQVTESPKDSWGTGLIENGNENLFTTIRALDAGVFGEAEKERLAQAYEKQARCFREAVLAEVEAVQEITEGLKQLNRKF